MPVFTAVVLKVQLVDSQAFKVKNDLPLLITASVRPKIRQCSSIVCILTAAIEEIKSHFLSCRGCMVAEWSVLLSHS